MTFAILFIENGDLVADFGSHEEAEGALREYVADHPEVADRVGILAFDESGAPAGDFEPARPFDAQPA